MANTICRSRAKPAGVRPEVQRLKADTRGKLHMLLGIVEHGSRAVLLPMAKRAGRALRIPVLMPNVCNKMRSDARSGSSGLEGRQDDEKIIRDGKSTVRKEFAWSVAILAIRVVRVKKCLEFLAHDRFCVARIRKTEKNRSWKTQICSRTVRTGQRE
jgi:hypothetical protein